MVGKIKKDEKTNEEYYAAVIWKDFEEKHHIVGTLAYFNGKYYFKYEQTRLEEARKKHFEDVGAFSDDEKLYISENSLFNFFKLRVSPKNKEVPTALEELLENRGRSSTDDISIFPIPEVYKPGIKAEIIGLETSQKLSQEEAQLEI